MVEISPDHKALISGEGTMGEKGEDPWTLAQGAEKSLHLIVASCGADCQVPPDSKNDTLQGSISMIFNGKFWSSSNQVGHIGIIEFTDRLA